MSIKIHNGIQFDNLHKLFISDIDSLFLDNKRTLYECQKTIWKVQIIKTIIQEFLKEEASLENSVIKVMNKCRDESLVNTYYPHNFTFAFLPLEHKILGISYHYLNLQSVFLKNIEHIKYSYFDNRDKPDDILEKDWQQRYEDYSSFLKTSPVESGLFQSSNIEWTDSLKKELLTDLSLIDLAYLQLIKYKKINRDNIIKKDEQYTINGNFSFETIIELRQLEKYIQTLAEEEITKLTDNININNWPSSEEIMAMDLNFSYLNTLETKKYYELLFSNQDYDSFTFFKLNHEISCIKKDYIKKQKTNLNQLSIKDIILNGDIDSEPCFYTVKNKKRLYDVYFASNSKHLMNNPYHLEQRFSNNTYFKTWNIISSIF